MRVPWKWKQNLKELGYGPNKIIVYRALPAKNPIIKEGDYLTLSLKFAKEHAQHMAITEEEDQLVVSFLAPSENIVGASNPGEYRYFGGAITRVSPIYVARAFSGQLQVWRRASASKVASLYLSKNKSIENGIIRSGRGLKDGNGEERHPKTREA